MNIFAKFQLYPPYGFWGEDFSIFFRKFSLSNIFVKLLSTYLQWVSNQCHFFFFIFPHYKSMATVSQHSNQSFYPIKIKTPLSVSPAHRFFTYLGKSCSFGLPRVPFVNCCQFMYLVISLSVLRAGCGIWLCRFLIVACLFTFLCEIWTESLSWLRRRCHWKCWRTTTTDGRTNGRTKNACLYYKLTYEPSARVS